MTIKNRTVGLELTTSTQDIYLVPNNFKATVDSIVVANKSASFVKVTLDWYSALNTTSYVVFGDITLEPNSSMQITDPLYLEEGDKIRGVANLGSSIVVSVRTSEEYTVARR